MRAGGEEVDSHWSECFKRNAAEGWSNTSETGQEAGSAARPGSPSRSVRPCFRASAPGELTPWASFLALLSAAVRSVHQPQESETPRDSLPAPLAAMGADWTPVIFSHLRPFLPRVFPPPTAHLHPIHLGRLLSHEWGHLQPHPLWACFP